MFLTWPQSGFDLDGALLRLREQGGKHLVFARICHELHDDGQPHRHALLCFARKVDFADERRFDIDGRHPKWDANVRSAAKAYDYVAKDGVFRDWGTVPDLEPPKSNGRNELWGRLLDEATDRESFMQSVREHAPYEFCTR